MRNFIAFLVALLACSISFGADAGAAEASTPFWQTAAIYVGVTLLVAAIYPAAEWLKKQKLIKKFHLEGTVDRGVEKIVRWAETQKNRKAVTHIIDGEDARNAAIEKAKEVLGLGHSKAEDEVDATYDKVIGAPKRAAAAAKEAAAAVPFQPAATSPSAEQS